MSGLEERFWSKVEARSDGCWVWTSSTDDRYGTIWVDGRMEKAHRVAYRLVVGPIPDGFEIDHLCPTLLCVRPSHIEAVSPTMNLQREALRKVAQGVRPHNYGSHTEYCPNGHPKTPENVRVSRGWHLCRVCERERRARRRSAA